jgi:hypothetical protein
MVSRIILIFCTLLLEQCLKIRQNIHTNKSRGKSYQINDCLNYASNQTLHDDLKVPFIKDVIQENRINHHDKLGNHSNPILQPLLKQRRRLKKLWPADLIDG